MQLFDQGHALFHAVAAQKLGAAEDHGGGALYLINEKFTEVLGVDPAFTGVHHRGAAAYDHIRMALLRLFDRGKDLAELADARGLHQNAGGMIGVDQLVDRSLEVARQSTADAAGVKLCHRDADILHKGAVHADLAVFVFQQNHLFILQTAG